MIALHFFDQTLRCSGQSQEWAQASELKQGYKTIGLFLNYFKLLTKTIINGFSNNMEAKTE